MSERTPRLPSRQQWLGLGVSGVAELHAGKQSRVFAATVDGEKVAVKLTERSLTDPSVLRTRMLAVELLADFVAVVVAPQRIGGELVHEMGEWLMTMTTRINGEQLDIANSNDAQLMGRTLARLHSGLAMLPACDLPSVAALDSSSPPAVLPSDWQLLHGDFSDQNAVRTHAGLRVFDFDDCGYGPVEFDVANSLYMVLFDSTVNDQPRRYEAFRPWFLRSYAEVAGTAIDDRVLDDMIDVRVRALGRWIDDLPNAPIGIRTATPAWLEVLRRFVLSH